MNSKEYEYFNSKLAALIDSINSGFVQRDAENAKLQLKALSKALGFEVNDDLSVIRLGDEKKKQRDGAEYIDPACSAGDRLIQQRLLNWL